MSKIPTYDPTEIGPSYFQHEQWFEVSIGEDFPNDGKIGVRKPYILVINSYGRLRKLFTDGGYKDIHDGGSLTAPPHKEI